MEIDQEMATYTAAAAVRPQEAQGQSGWQWYAEGIAAQERRDEWGRVTGKTYRVRILWRRQGGLFSAALERRHLVYIDGQSGAVMQQVPARLCAGCGDYAELRAASCPHCGSPLSP